MQEFIEEFIRPGRLAGDRSRASRPAATNRQADPVAERSEAL